MFFVFRVIHALFDHKLGVDVTAPSPIASDDGSDSTEDDTKEENKDNSIEPISPMKVIKGGDDSSASSSESDSDSEDITIPSLATLGKPKNEKEKKRGK